MTPYLLVQSTQAPYSSSSAIDALEAALAATNVGLDVKYVFIHDGVYQLLNSQQPQKIEHKSIYKKLAALPLFDIEDCFVLASSLSERGLNSNDIGHAQSICDNTFNALCTNAQQILVF